VIALKWIQKLERKFGRYAIQDLMLYIVILHAVVFFTNFLVPQSNLYGKFALIPSRVLHGEIWRLVTFLFLPSTTSPIQIVFTLYFYYLVGSNLEHQWGSFRFNLYYLIGVLSTIAAAFIGRSPVTAEHLNLSLFLAFAYLFPNFEILLFFILPIKVKYIGWFNWAFLVCSILFNPLPWKLSAVASVVNYLVFFGPDLIQGLKLRRITYKNRKRFRDASRKNRW
jgi:hypothetical protein